MRFNDGGGVRVRGGEERQKGLDFVSGEVKREAIVDVIAKRKKRRDLNPTFAYIRQGLSFCMYTSELNRGSSLQILMFFHLSALVFIRNLQTPQYNCM